MEAGETRHEVSQSVRRCGARTRAGSPCQRLPVRGKKRCRLHGGASPGAPRGAKNPNFKTGEWTREAIEERRWIREMVRMFAKAGGAA
jgi:glucans biosynthesis protein